MATVDDKYVFKYEYGGEITRHKIIPDLILLCLITNKNTILSKKGFSESVRSVFLTKYGEPIKTNDLSKEGLEKLKKKDQLRYDICVRFMEKEISKACGFKVRIRRVEKTYCGAREFDKESLESFLISKGNLSAVSYIDDSFYVVEKI